MDLLGVASIPGRETAGGGMKVIAALLTILASGIVFAGSSQEINLIQKNAETEKQNCADGCSMFGSGCRHACSLYDKDYVNYDLCFRWCSANESFCRIGCGVSGDILDDLE